MLTITIEGTEMFDEIKQEFIYSKDTTIELEHSLFSLSKWESKWHKPFLANDKKTTEQVIDYIKCMTITENVDPTVYSCISNKDMAIINKYIDDPMTATWFNNANEKTNARTSGETITSEIIYYWMVTLSIPFECQYWHLNRLLTLVRVCNAKNNPPKKMSKRDILSKQSALNAARRKQSGSNG